MTDIIDTPTDNDGDAPEPASTSRRSFVSKGALAAAVGAAAGIALSEKASAANGDTWHVGETDSASNTTQLIGGSTLRVQSGSSSGNASIRGIADNDTNSASHYGIRGEYFDIGDGTGRAGVYGYSRADNAAGVYGSHEGSTTSGPGVRGVSESGNGVYGEASSSITSAAGVYGVSQSTQSAIGVYGTTSGTQSRSVYGVASGTSSSAVEGLATARGSVGVRAIFLQNVASDTGDGIYATSDAGDGVVARGTRYDLYAEGTGIANLTAAASTIGPSSTGAAGSLARNADGSLWYCYDTDSWREISGSSTGGAFHPVTPFRVYDSRQETDGRFAGDENRTISVADSRDVDTYAVVTADAVPVGATAVTGNVVAIGTTDLGFLSINPGGVTAISAATVNWAAGQNIGNAGTFTLNSSRELEAVFGPGNGAHMTIDITGYYL